MADVMTVGGPNVTPQEANPGGAMVPFRRATTNRNSRISTTTLTMTTAQQGVEVTVEGSGFIYGVHLDIQGTTAANAATVVYAEDAPWSSIASVIFRDVNGSLVDVTGFHLYLANLYGGWVSNGKSLATSLDSNVYGLTAGVGAGLGGSFRAPLFVPVALNRRSLVGILGNQDRAQRYSLRTDLAPSTSVYTTAPTTLPAVAINRFYDNYAVPASHNANGAPQQQLPDKLGVLHFITQTTNPGSAPLGGSTVNHYLPRLGNTVRAIILVFRLNGSRTTAEASMPTSIQFKLGDMVLFDENTAVRRRIMFDRFGFDAPAGVICYDWETDMDNAAGGEFGDDWLFTAGLVNAQFVITYPAGFGSTNNTLTVLTLDLQIPPTIDIYA